MSALLELSEQLQGLSAAIATHERALAEAPSPSLVASLNSLKKRMNRLEADFAAIAANRGIDVCRYRFLTELAKATITPVCAALSRFQYAYTLAFDAIKNGRKLIGRVSQDVIEQTEFGIGYSYPGSLGIALTFQNQRVKLFESTMDAAMDSLFGVLSAGSPEDVLEFGKQLGAPPIKAVYQWAKVHADYGIGFDVSWINGENVKRRLQMEPRRLVELLEVLDRTSEENSETIVKTGSVVGGEHLSRHQFHFLADDGADIAGTYQDAIGPEHPVRWPMRYRATIRKTVKVFYTTDNEEKATYLLLALEELPE